MCGEGKSSHAEWKSHRAEKGAGVLCNERSQGVRNPLPPSCPETMESGFGEKKHFVLVHDAGLDRRLVLVQAGHSAGLRRPQGHHP
ncbi:hypothetical protein Taro_004226 [Colocasia esculenta]|uniref:Uncharacterized protein n=1 Tax=Colocasia esculenta TaxID=4460 RepID=A0A843TNT9_COLES|nr:hypothetical protein [Colocasia esculenta]